jgi:hypothetical protein
VKFIAVDNHYAYVGTGQAASMAKAMQIGDAYSLEKAREARLSSFFQRQGPGAAFIIL